jgi:hypothetical protein
MSVCGTSLGGARSLCRSVARRRNTAHARCCAIRARRAIIDTCHSSVPLSTLCIWLCLHSRPPPSSLCRSRRASPFASAHRSDRHRRATSHSTDALTNQSNTRHTRCTHEEEWNTHRTIECTTHTDDRPLVRRRGAMSCTKVGIVVTCTRKYARAHKYTREARRIRMSQSASDGGDRLLLRRGATCSPRARLHAPTMSRCASRAVPTCSGNLSCDTCDAQYSCGERSGRDDRAAAAERRSGDARHTHSHV